MFYGLFQYAVNNYPYFAAVGCDPTYTGYTVDRDIQYDFSIDVGNTDMLNIHTIWHHDGEAKYRLIIIIIYQTDFYTLCRKHER